MGVITKTYGLRMYDRDKACEGFTLVSPVSTRDVFLLDIAGNYVHHWKMASNPRNDTTLLPNGNLLSALGAALRPESDLSHPRVGAWGTGGGIVEVDWQGKEMWKYVDTIQHHAHWRMRNGNTIYPVSMQAPKKVAVKLKGGIPGTEDRGIVWTDGFHEVTPAGDLEWEWQAGHHLDPERHSLCPIEYRATWSHMNSIEELPDGNILTSMRNIDTICIVERSTGRIIWEWGRGEVSHQHAPTMLGNGNILLFDNGAHRQDGSLLSYSRVVEVNPNTNQIEWEYRGHPRQSFYSALISNAQRLPNGNTLICEGLKGRIFEITKEGLTVWEYVSPFYAPITFHLGAQSLRVGLPRTNAVFRAYRYMPDYPGLKGKDLNPENLPWLNRLYAPDSHGSEGSWN